MSHYEKPYLGVISGLAAFFCYSAMDTLIKFMAKGYPLPLVIFSQSSVILLIMFAYSRARKQTFMLNGSHYPYRQFVRTIFHVISGCSGYAAYTQMPLATFYTVGFLGPLLISLMAWIVFKDAPTRSTWFALGIGFIGMLVIARPDTLPMNQQTLLAFIWIIFGAINVMFVRTMPKDHPNIFTVYTHTTLLLTMSVFAIPHLPELRFVDIIYPITGGAAAAIAGYLFYNAYRLAPSSLVAPTQYTQIVWGALAGWFVFGSGLTVHLFIGAAFIALAGWIVLTQSHMPASSHTIRRAGRGFGIRFSPAPVRDVTEEKPVV